MSCTLSRAARSPSLLWINHFAVSPSDGGGTRHFELSRELTVRDWRVTIAATDFHLQTRTYTRRPGPAFRAPVPEQLDGVDFLWLWSAPYTRNDWRRGWNWISFGQSLSRWHPEGAAADVVIGSSPQLFAALAGARMASRLGVPFVLEVRDLWPESLLAVGGRKGLAYHAFGAMARYLYRRADRIVVLARGSADHIARYGVDAKKLVYVPNGVDLNAFTRRPEGSADSFTLVYAGAHGPANGLDAVLDAAELLRNDPRVRFLFVGDGPAKSSLREDAARRNLTNIEFRDPVAKSNIPALFASADAGLMVLRDSPLFAYGVSPNKLFDYFGAALPVVCNVPGDVAGMVAEAGAGEQAADSSGAALADAIRRLVARSPEERARMGLAGRAWVAREHSRPVLAERLDGMLRELIAR
jgi:glycosyltransferase involved in cell wall biosynthesis